VAYRLLDEFRKLFEGQCYIHRKSTSGDFVATHLFEDLHALGKSRLLRARIEARSRVLNAPGPPTARRATGIPFRRHRKPNPVC
jgi:hypothetical protein